MSSQTTQAPPLIAEPAPREAAISQGPSARARRDDHGLVARAWELAPLLAERAAEAEKLGRTPDDVLETIKKTGLMKMVRPTRFGGHGLRPDIIFDVCSVLGRGCASTAWVVANLAVHELYLALWPISVQEEIWGEDPDVLIGSTFVFPAGRAEKTDGGYIVNGRWPFSSGIHPCGWTINGAVVPAKDGEPASQRYILLRRDQYDILDTWHVAALRGTGSTDVQATDAFVPDALTIGYVDVIQGRAPGLDGSDNGAPRFPLAIMGGFILLSAIYGASRGALDRFVADAKGRTARSSGKGLAAEPTFQSKVAEAGALLDAVEAITDRNFAEVNEAIDRQESFTDQRALRLRRDASFCAKLCVQAIDLVFGLGGGSALYDSNPLQRVWRDVHGGAAHIVFQWDVHGVASGRVELGLPSGMPGMLV